MPLSVDQILEESIRINPMRCVSVKYDQYKAIETKQSTIAIIGCPTNNAHIQRDQLLSDEKISTAQEEFAILQKNGMDGSLTIDGVIKSGIKWEFDLWASVNGQSYNTSMETQPHTLLNLMRLEEKNTAKGTNIMFLSEGLKRNILSKEEAGNIISITLEYCQNFGFPKGDIVESKDGNLYYGCTIDELYFLEPNGLNHIYDRYMAWRYLQLDDLDAKKHFPASWDSPLIRDFIYTETAAGCEPISINVSLTYKNGTPEIHYFCNSQLDMAAMQLMYIMARGDRYIENGRILNCKGCNQPFLATHGSRQYCDRCNANSTVRVRTTRARKNTDKHSKKEAPNNGK